MEVQIGSEYLAPDPDGDGMIRVRVVARGEKADGVEIEGTPGKRDIAWVMYLEGDRDGTVGKVIYERFKPLPEGSGG